METMIAEIILTKLEMNRRRKIQTGASAVSQFLKYVDDYLSGFSFLKYLEVYFLARFLKSGRLYLSWEMHLSQMNAVERTGKQVRQKG